MKEDVQELKDASSAMMNTFLNEDLVAIEEADLIEGKNREYQNNK